MAAASSDPFNAKSSVATAGGDVTVYKLQAVQDAGLVDDLAKLPYCIRVLLENALRNCDGFQVTEEAVRTLAGWKPKQDEPTEIPYKPARVILQDFTGVPAVVDLASLRTAMTKLGGDPAKINPLVPVDLVVDHSVQVDHFASGGALDLNVQMEFVRNKERYEFLRWGQQAFDNFQIVPPATGIVHQVNLEYLARVVFKDNDGVAYPDTLVGTDSHTTMINGLGVMGWGVGGIEAEAVMLGQPIYMLLPEVVGFRLTGKLAEGATATDMVLVVTEMLRKHGVVGKFVEFFGEGMESLSLPDRATIANMAPEYGATMGFFPIDTETLRYMRLTGREEEQIDLVEKYCRAQGLFHTADSADPDYTDTLELDLSMVVPSLAGPKRPQDRITLDDMQDQWQKDLRTTFARDDARPGPGAGPGSTAESWKTEGGGTAVAAEQLTEDGVAVEDPAEDTGVPCVYDGQEFLLDDGAVVIGAITSCTNTSNPSVMIAAGLVARKARQKGLDVKPWVKTSLAPGSRVVTNYYEKSGLDKDLDALGFQTVGYGCTTCIGNSGPLPTEIGDAIDRGELVAASVLSGNRNFEGRVHPKVKANYLASPPLVVAYSLAGTVNTNLAEDPLGAGSDGQPVYLKDIWPTNAEIQEIVGQAVTPQMFRDRYADVFTGNETWNKIDAGSGQIYDWDGDSTYIQNPPFFDDLSPEPAPLTDIEDARVLLKLGQSVTTDHISPAGAIKADSPAGKYLQDHGVPPKEFNSYGSRRGNDRVMTRGTFANIRVRNQLAPGTEGGVTRHQPSGEQMSVYEASRKYIAAGVPTIVLAGGDYGMGSSRDWAAKGTLLLGVRAVIAESFERIHRSNLVGMGVLPLEFLPGDTCESLGLTGAESFTVTGIAGGLTAAQTLHVVARSEDGKTTEFDVRCRIDTPVEIDYYRNGGILQTVLRGFLKG